MRGTTTTGRSQTWFARFVLAFLGAKIAVLVLNVFRFPTLRPQPSDANESVSLLIPMRNEAQRLPGTLPGLLAQDAAEIIFLDDESRDGSAALVRTAIDAGHVRGRVVAGASRPPGWAGKTWALEQLAHLAGGDILVFCDADVRLQTGAVAAVVAEMDCQGAGMFSVFPRQVTESLGEHLLVPLIDDVLLALLPFPLLEAPVPSAATANGSLLAFRRSTYFQLGGHAAVRSAVVEDVAMARHTRRQGHRLGLALGGELVQTRMYDSWAGLVVGFGRGLRPVLGGSRTLLVLGWLVHAGVYTVPALLLPTRHRRWLPVGLAVLERVLVEAKTGRRRWAQAPLNLVGPVAAVPVVWRSLHRVQNWKGRAYS